MVGAGKDLWGSSSPTPLPKQSHLQQAAQDLVHFELTSVCLDCSDPGPQLPSALNPEPWEAARQHFQPWDSAGT